MSHNFPTVASAQLPSSKQRLYLRYFTAVLTDLIVLNLFAEYWEYVTIDSFTITLLVAILLQVLLRITLAIEGKAAHYFQEKSGGIAKFMRYFSAWAILFGSKFVMLGAIDFVFGSEVLFGGPLHGVVAFIVVVVAILLAEELNIRFYRRLADGESRQG